MASFAEFNRCRNVYHYAAPAVAEDNRSRSHTIRLPQRTICTHPPGLVNSCVLDTNALRCAQDVPYYQPVAAGDALMLQFAFADGINNWNANPTAGWRVEPSQTQWLIAIEVVGACCEALPEPVPFAAFAQQYFVGAYADGSRIQQIEVNTEPLPECFRFRILVNTPTGIEAWYTEPYRKERCDHSLWIEAQYPAPFRDCSGNRYGAPEQILGTYFAYNNGYRLRGTIENVAWLLEADRAADGTARRTTTRHKRRLRSSPVPLYAVQRIESILAAPTVYVDGEPLVFTGELNRNNEIGAHWLLDFTLETPPCRQETRCSA